MEFEADGAAPGGRSRESPPPQERGEVPSPRFDSSRALRLLRELGTNVTEKCKSEGTLAQSGPVLLLSQTERSLLFIMQIDALAVSSTRWICDPGEL